MKVEIIGKFYDNHSLSIINRNLAFELQKNNIDVSILAVDNITNSNISIEEKIKVKSLKNEIIDEPDIQIRHTYPPSWKWPLSDKTKIVYIQPWEFFSIPSEWQYKFDTFADAVLVPSNWNKSVYENAGINPKKIFVVPNGYDPNVFYNKETKSDKVLKFLYVGCGQYRKGLDILLKMWSSVTSQFDNLELIIKDTPEIYGDSDIFSEILKLQYKNKCAKITYIDSNLTVEELSNLYNSAHFLIHPYRGEGFGMHVQEAMACGCVPIVTAGGPTDDFVFDYKIASSTSVVNMHNIFGMKPEDSLSNMGQHRIVLEPNPNSLFEILKEVIADYTKVSLVNTSKLSTWEKVGKEYVTALEAINNFDAVKRMK